MYIIALLITKQGVVKTRREIIQEAIDRFNGSRIQVIYFNNVDVPYIPYWYDAPTDKLMSQNASVIITHKSEDIDVVIMEGYISR